MKVNQPPHRNIQQPEMRQKLCWIHRMKNVLTLEFDHPASMKLPAKNM